MTLKPAFRDEWKLKQANSGAEFREASEIATILEIRSLTSVMVLIGAKRGLIS